MEHSTGYDVDDFNIDDFIQTRSPPSFPPISDQEDGQPFHNTPHYPAFPEETEEHVSSSIQELQEQGEPLPSWQQRLPAEIRILIWEYVFNKKNIELFYDDPPGGPTVYSFNYCLGEAAACREAYDVFRSFNPAPQVRMEASLSPSKPENRILPVGPHDSVHFQLNNMVSLDAPALPRVSFRNLYLGLEPRESINLDAFMSGARFFQESTVENIFFTDDLNHFRPVFPLPIEDLRLRMRLAMGDQGLMAEEEDEDEGMEDDEPLICHFGWESGVDHVMDAIDSCSRDDDPVVQLENKRWFSMARRELCEMRASSSSPSKGLLFEDYKDRFSMRTPGKPLVVPCGVKIRKRVDHVNRGISWTIQMSWERAAQFLADVWLAFSLCENRPVFGQALMRGPYEGIEEA